MKKLIFLCFCLFLSTTYSIAQGYTFSVSQSIYSNLSQSTSVSNGATWDDPSYILPIGFTFNVYNHALTEFSTDQGFGALLTAPDVFTSPSSILVAYGSDIIDRGYNFTNGPEPTGALSNISYLTEGPPGNQICKIEWKNVGFYSEFEDDGVSTDFTNFQLWLYESTGNIEIHFGPNSVTDPNLCYDDETGPFIGIYAAYNFNTLNNLSSALELTGPANSPTAQASNEPYLTFTDGTVSNGKVYHFTRTLVGLEDQLLTENDFSLWPNPTKDEVWVSLSNKTGDQARLVLTNQLGQILETKEIPSSQKNERQFDLSKLDAGLYFVSLVQGNQRLTKKVIKQ